MQKIYVSVNIITLGRDSIYKALEFLLNQKFSHPYEINLILQWNIDQDKINKLNKKDIPINIYNYKHNLGFWYYRNQAIQKSKWKILAWIDDDEWTKDNKRLYNITKEIFEWKYKAITWWYNIKLWEWYRTDCISLLWYPWWWAIWFSKMRTVNSHSETKHICTWNFAFDRSILDKTWLFNENLKHWTEDVTFADSINRSKIKILYQKESTTNHIPRSWIIDFIKRHFNRWKASYQLSKYWSITKHHQQEKLRSIKNILFNSDTKLKYIPWIRLMFIIQYLSQIIWFICAKIYAKN